MMSRSISTTCRCFNFFSSGLVIAPKPGPISTRLSSGSGRITPMMSAMMRSSTRKFWPNFLKFGQNFLVDERIIADIIGVIRPEPDDNLVEIGPGLGAMTRPLLKKLKHLHVVEIDRDIIARLESDYPQDRPD